MPELPKLRKVSWAPDFNLCQVRLFLTDDAPLSVGFAIQDHLQARASLSSHPSGASPEDALPPGFEGGRPGPQIRSCDVPLIIWRCPPRFSVDLSWQVVAGEESEEMAEQSQREMRVFEAVYPRPSSIPQNPCFSAEVDEATAMDSLPVLVPITAVEDEDPADTFDAIAHPSETKAPAQLPMVVVPDIVADSIDHELLLKLLSNRALTENLVAEANAGANLMNMAATIAQYGSSNKQNTAVATPPPGYPPASAFPFSGGQQVKDMSYYKSLIQQHGGDRQELPKHHLNSRYSKPKYMKPCAFFNTSGGCRNGANCAYQHDTSVQHRSTGSMADSQTAKRMKMDREISS